ncbi:MAG: hypothetical protein QNJ48_09100 [Desulfobacterales bacterium]|nr:hypothetical protein [Desulfobacterales bacterium]
MAILPILAVLLVRLAEAAAAASVDSGGPLFLHVSSGVKIEYNDNLFFTPQRQKEDLITTGRLGIDAGYKTERFEFGLNPNWRYYKYQDEDDLDDHDQIYRARLEARLTPRIKFSSEGAYINDNRREDQVLETGVVFENIERTRVETTLSTEFLLSEKTAVSLFGQYWNDDYEDRRVRGSLSDLEAKGGGMAFTHQLGAFYRPTYLRSDAGYFNYDYDTAETDYYYLTVGASTEINEKYTLRAQAGPRYTDSEYNVAREVTSPTSPSAEVVTDDERSSSWGANGLLSLHYNGEKTNWALALSREVTAASGQTQATKQTELRLDLDHRWTWELSSHLLMRYFDQKSDRDNSDLGDVDKAILVLEPQVRYRINNDWFLQSTYRYTWRDDNNIDESWDRNQVLIEIGHNWKIWE